MRILMITQWFDPEPTFKGLILARAFRRQGHEVTVLTGFPNYPGGKVYPGYRIRPWKWEETEGVRILRVALFPSHSRSVVGRSLNYLSFAASACLGVFFLRRHDVAYVYHPPGTAALPAMLARAIRRVPFVIDIQDMWPDTLSATTMVRGNFIMRSLGALMRAVYRRAAHIVTLSQGFAKLLEERGVEASKITVIPNWTHEAEGASPTVLDRDEVFGKAEFVVLFAGTMGGGQGLDTVLNSAKLLEERGSPAVLVLMGGGIDRERLVARSREMALDNVRFLERCSPERAAQITAIADAVLVHLRDDPLFSITIPSKTQAYLRAGKPILMGVRGDAADMVLRAGAGLTFTPENAGSLADAVERMRQLGPDDLAKMGTAGKRYYDAELALNVGAGRLTEVLGAVARKPRHADSPA